MVFDCSLFFIGDRTAAKTDAVAIERCKNVNRLNHVQLHRFYYLLLPSGDINFILQFQSMVLCERSYLSWCAGGDAVTSRTGQPF